LTDIFQSIFAENYEKYITFSQSLIIPPLLRKTQAERVRKSETVRERKREREREGGRKSRSE
jgi:hypothetical protein